MVVRKILEAALVAGSTSVTFTDTDIPNSLLRVYCSRSALFPISQTLSGNSVTVNYKPQDINIGVALEIVKSGLDIVDDLTTEDNTKALSANQGYVLKGLIDDIVIPTVPENITDLDDVDVTNITAGQVLAWDDTVEKFVNVNQSGGGKTNDYSTSETIVGTYNGKPLYRKMFTTPISTNNVVYGIIYNTGIDISQFVSDVDQLFPILDHSWIDIGSGIRGFLTLNNEDNIAIDCSTFYSRTGTAHITVEYTKTTD